MADQEQPVPEGDRIRRPRTRGDRPRSQIAQITNKNRVYWGFGVQMIEFHSVREHRSAAGQRVVTEARLDGAALTDNPSYPDTGVEVRTGTPSRPPLRGILRWL